MSWLKKEYRKNIIDQITSTDNMRRKNMSVRNADIQKNKLNGHVVDYLKTTYQVDTVSEMPVIDSINIQKRVVSKQATIYSDKPVRMITGIDKEKPIEYVEKSSIDKSMAKANKIFKYQDQCFLQCVPDIAKKNFKIRVFQPHHVDVIPSKHDPEIAEAYIVSVFNKTDYKTSTQSSATGYDSKNTRQNQINNKEIGDANDYMGAVGIYLVWTREYNFFMNQAGDILNKEDFSVMLDEQEEKILSPIQGVIPFVDISSEKDFEFFIQSEGHLATFTIQLNAALSDLGHIVRMQGYSQAYLKGPASLLTENVKVGPAYLLRLISEPQAGIDSEFGFATPSADISGAISYIETLLSMFLTSNGVSAKAVTSKGESDKFSSGLERLLAMFDEFRASSEDYVVFEKAEKDLFEIMKAWLSVIDSSLPLDSELSIQFSKPTSVMSDSEKLDVIQKKKDLGLSSTIDDIQSFYEISREEAEERFEKIKEDEENERPDGIEVEQVGSESEVQPSGSFKRHNS